LAVAVPARPSTTFILSVVKGRSGKRSRWVSCQSTVVTQQLFL